MRQNPIYLRAKTREALLKHLNEGMIVPDQGRMLEVEASPLIDRCLSEFDELVFSVVPSSSLAISTNATLRLEIIAGQVLAATLHGRLNLSQDILHELVTIFQETIKPVRNARDACAEAWLWLRFAELEMRPAGSINTLGMDLPFEDRISGWLIDRIDAGPNAAHFTFSGSEPHISRHASSLVSVFLYPDAGKISQIIDRSEQRVKACPNRTGLTLRY